MKLYSIFDEVTNQWSAPIIAKNGDDVKRRIYASYSVPAMAPFIKDLRVHFIGKFNPDNVTPIIVTPPEYVCRVAELFEVKDNAEA